jgi:2-polyprenyl-3-methyl-5-hydroxy-6-metoxy-1,4-benzoquinol methylase
MQRPTDREFKIEDYQEFYSHHQFTPIPDQFAINVGQAIPRMGWAVDVAQEIQPKNTLDLGCLDGSLTLTLLNNVPSIAKGTGVDLTQDGVELARERASIHGLVADFHQESVEEWLKTHIAAKGEKFDLITAFEIMEHVLDPELLVELMGKVLAPGGTMLISTPDFEAPTYGKDDEDNKCHIRLYTTADEDYEAKNKYGTLRKASSITKLLKNYKIEEMDVINELINVRVVK